MVSRAELCRCSAGPINNIAEAFDFAERLGLQPTVAVAGSAHPGGQPDNAVSDSGHLPASATSTGRRSNRRRLRRVGLPVVGRSASRPTKLDRARTQRGLPTSRDAGVDEFPRAAADIIALWAWPASVAGGTTNNMMLVPLMPENLDSVPRMATVGLQADSAATDDDPGRRIRPFPAQMAHIADLAQTHRRAPPVGRAARRRGRRFAATRRRRRIPWVVPLA